LIGAWRVVDLQLFPFTISNIGYIREKTTSEKVGSVILICMIKQFIAVFEITTILNFYKCRILSCIGLS